MRTLVVLMALLAAQNVWATTNPSIPPDTTPVIYETKIQNGRWGGWVDPVTSYNFFALDAVSAGNPVEIEIERTAGELATAVTIYDSIGANGITVADLGDPIYADPNAANLESYSLTWTPTQDHDGITLVVGNKVNKGKADFYLTTSVPPGTPRGGAVPEPSSAIVWIMLGVSAMVWRRRHALAI